MHRLGELINMIDRTLNTKKKKHIAGGILMSISLLFGGLAITVLSMNIEKMEDNYPCVLE